jgi:hypothetical protein
MSVPSVPRLVVADCRIGAALAVVVVGMAIGRVNGMIIDGK